MKNNNKTSLSSLCYFVFISLFLSGCGSGGSSSQEVITSESIRALTIPSFKSAGYPVDIDCDVDAPDVVFQLDDAFNLDTAFILLQASYLTEQEMDLSEAHYRQWGFNKVRIYQNPSIGMRAYIAEREEFVIVAYRGTTDPFEYVSNATFITEDVPEYEEGARMHLGFWHAHSVSRDEVQDEIKALGGDSKPVIFTGHSRGGVMAALQASYFITNGGDVPFIYTFAQPRLGNAQLSMALDNQFGDRYYRMDYVTDVTPKVPPSADVAEPLLNEGYIPFFLANLVNDLEYDYDPGELYILSDGGDLVLDEMPQETQLDFWRDFFTTYSNLLFSLGDLIQALPEDHVPSNYLCQLSKHYQ